MIGLDTNVVVRYIMQDDPRQSPLATKFIESLTAESPGFVTLISTVELAWVLAACYDLKREQVAQALELLLRTKEIVVDRAHEVLRALHAFRAGTGDLADCLIERIASSAGCRRTITFDVAAAKSAGMTLLK
jgi:predicted nucleic-acid-binding protein